MRPHLVTSKAEYRRRHDKELREIAEEVEYLVDRARSVKGDLKDDVPNSRDSQARVEVAIANLGSAAWYLRGARKELP